MHMMAIAASAAVMLVAAAPARAASDAAQIKATFKAYKRSLLKKDGAACAAVVDSGTIDYYQRMRDLAVSGAAAEVKKLSLLDKLMVGRMRLQIPVAELKAMDGRGALAHGVAQGWIGKDGAAVAELGAIDVDGDQASASFVIEGKKTPIKISLRREKGAWRVDLRSLFKMAEGAFSMMQKDSGKNADDFIVELLEQVSGGPVPPTIWDPPR